MCRNMPDIETLMQEWPPGFEDAIRDVCYVINYTYALHFSIVSTLDVEGASVVLLMHGTVLLTL